MAGWRVCAGFGGVFPTGLHGGFPPGIRGVGSKNTQPDPPLGSRVLPSSPRSIFGSPERPEPTRFSVTGHQDGHSARIPTRSSSASLCEGRILEFSLAVTTAVLLKCDGNQGAASTVADDPVTPLEGFETWPLQRVAQAVEARGRSRPISSARCETPSLRPRTGPKTRAAKELSGIFRPALESPGTGQSGPWRIWNACRPLRGKLFSGEWRKRGLSRRRDCTDSGMRGSFSCAPDVHQAPQEQ